MRYLLLSLMAMPVYAQLDLSFLETSLTPKIQIKCQSQMGEVFVDLEKGTLSYSLSGQKVVMRLERFSLEKVSGDKKGVILDVQGNDADAVDRNGDISKTASANGSSIHLRSYLPKKDNGSFKAGAFDLTSSVQFNATSNLRIQDNTRNSTACVLVSGGKLVKDMSKKSSAKTEIVYSRPAVDNSDRNLLKEIPSDSTPGIQASDAAAGAAPR